MDDGRSTPLPVPASVADADVPAERLETAYCVRRSKRRANRFLKGPIPLTWIREYVQCPADRLLLVLRAHGDMQRSAEIKVTATVLRDAGIADRKATYRALNKLEASGALSVSRKRGQRTVIRLAQTETSPG